MKKLIISLGLIVPTALFGQIDRSAMPKAGPAPTINIEDSEVFTTPNGITVILSENHKIPKVSFNLVMGATPKVEGTKAGLSEVAGSLIMSGTSTRSKDQIDNEIDMIGARLSADNNSIRLSCLTKHMDKGLSLMSDVTMNANFPQSEVDRIISMNESSLMAAKSDEGTMSRNVRSVANFPASHPYGEIMTAETLKNIDKAGIENYYKETFTPKGSYLTIVGDINKAEATEMVKKYFSTWTGGDVYTAELVRANKMNGNRVIFVNKPGSDQSVISVTFPMNIKPSSEDYLKLKVLNGVLGGGAFGNRLMQNLREDKAYTYGCRSGVSVNNYGSTFRAGGNFRNEVTDSAIVQILMEIERMTEDYVTDEELSLTKTSMAGAFSRSLESPSTVARFALSIIRNDLPKDYYQTYLKQLDAVTKEDLLMVAQKYFTATNLNIIVVGNEEVVDLLAQFDADGKVEKMDAFGKEVSDRVPADISADELLQKTTDAMAMGSSGKKLKKKLKKIKSYTSVMEIKLPQMPQPGTVTNVWSASGSEGSKMEMMGMVVQKSYFDGTAGGSTSMQEGSKVLTAEEVAAKQKSKGLIPEMNYATSGMKYELLGMEEFDGVMSYVLKLDDGDQPTTVYYSKETFLKLGSVTTIEGDGESQTVTYTFSNYKEYNGIMFADAINLSVGAMTLPGKVTSRVINGKFDLNDFK